MTKLWINNQHDILPDFYDYLVKNKSYTRYGPIDIDTPVRRLLDTVVLRLLTMNPEKRMDIVDFYNVIESLYNL